MKLIGSIASLLIYSLLLINPVWTPLVQASDSVRAAAEVPVEELRLANGMKILMVPQPEATTVAAGWMVQAGSANDTPGKTGLSHLLEHMMFKGSRVIGSRDLDRELEALNRVDLLWSERQELLIKLSKASNKKHPRLTDRIDALSTELETAQSVANSLAFQGQYSFLYSQQGGTGLNANTYRDLTLYYVTLPSEKLELWFWLEADRLLEPVFREFYKEIQVVHEERRQRIDSTPTGQLDEQLRGRFWQDHPYSWSPMGRAEDLDTLSRADALEFYRGHYRPDKMTAALVGGFDPQTVKTWAQRYFGRLDTSASVPSEPSPLAEREGQEKRWTATCNCPPQTQILYPTPRFDEPDSYALQLLAAVLNGRTGRLYRSLVVDQGIAFSAFAQQISWRLGGEFSFRAESKGGNEPETLVDAWDRQLAELQTRPPTKAEIDRAINRSIADAFRSIKEPQALLKQLLIYQGLGDWRYINQWTSRVQKVTPTDLVRVVTTYLRPEKRTVAIYKRPAEATKP